MSGKRKATNINASQVTKILEDLSIEGYILHKNHFISDPQHIEIKDAEDYYKLVNHLNLKSKEEYIGSPCFFYKLGASYKSWTFESKKERSLATKSA